jgi:glycerol-3-phosphate dehydrogenase
LRKSKRIFKRRNKRLEKELETQVLIVGGGVEGTSIARELAKYKVDAIVAEKEVDVAGGQTCRSAAMVYSPVGLSWVGSLVIKSIMCKPGDPLFHPESLKEKLTMKGFNMFEPLVRELNVSSYTKRTMMMIATTEDEVERLNLAQDICKQLGFEPERLNKEAVLAREPNVTKKVICAIADSPSDGAVYPWEYCMALAENARENGIRIMTGAEVQAIRPSNGGFVVDTARGPIRTEYIVNVAGAYADKVAQMAGVCDFGLSYMKGQTEILDKRLGGLVNNSVTPTPQPGKGGVIGRLPSGNIALGFVEYTPTEDCEDTFANREWTNENIATAREFVPDITERDIIKSFTGVRVFNTRDVEDHIIEATKKYPNFINAAIRLPGLAASPAIAEYVVNLLGNQGLALVRKADFNPYRTGIPKVSELPDEERQKLIAQDSRYGHVVCRCEEVSEGEIIEAIKRGARTVAGIKYRTRAGMGRCQGGFCGSRVVEILSRELDIPMTEVTQKGGLSRVLLYRSKELLG